MCLIRVMILIKITKKCEWNTHVIMPTRSNRSEVPLEYDVRVVGCDDEGDYGVASVLPQISP